VLPELQNLYLTENDWEDESEERDIELLIAVGQNFNHNVTIHRLPYQSPYRDWNELDRDWSYAYRDF
jgi:hypothetical protein